MRRRGPGAARRIAAASRGTARRGDKNAYENQPREAAVRMMSTRERKPSFSMARAL